MMYVLIVLFILVVGLISLKFYADKQNEHRYDERQLFLQKKAYSNAAWTAMVLNLVIGVESFNFERYFSMSFLGLANFFLILLVFVSSSILNDAYFTKNNKKKRFLYFYLFIIAIQLFAVYRQWSQGNFFRSGHLYLTAENSASLLFVLTFALILLVTAYKAWQDKKEVEE